MGRLFVMGCLMIVIILVYRGQIGCHPFAGAEI